VRCLRFEEAFDDELFGDGGDDTLMANAGADTLNGGPGNDRMELIGLVDPSADSLLDGGTGRDEVLTRRVPDTVLNMESVLDQRGQPIIAS
jgi:hypothetical protein